MAKNEPDHPNTHAVSEVNSLITPVHHLQHTAIPWSNSLTTSRARQEADTQHAVPIAFGETGGRGSCQAVNLFALTFCFKPTVQIATGR